MTKDERFLIELFRLNKGEPVNPQQVAEKLGYNKNLTQNILKGLMQANLVKRSSPDEVQLTPRGLNVAQTLTS